MKSQVLHSERSARPAAPALVYVSFDRVPAPKGAAVHIAAFARGIGAVFGGLDLVTIAGHEGEESPIPASPLPPRALFPGVTHHGLPATGEVPLAETVASSQTLPALATDGATSHFAAWASFGVDGSSFGIAGRWFAIGDGDMTLPLVYRDDVVDALLRAAEAPEAVGGVFNVVDLEPCTRTEYLRRAKRHLGAELRLVRMPLRLFMALAWGVEQLGRVLKRDVPLTRYRVRSLRPLGNFDQGAARTRLGWQPRVGLRRGLDATFGQAAD